LHTSDGEIRARTVVIATGDENLHAAGFFDQTAADLPDPAMIRGLRTPNPTTSTSPSP
jgi:hypothetical protein